VDRSRLRIDPANTIVHDVANVNVVRPVQSNAVRLRQLRLIRRTAIAAEAAHAGACRSRNSLRLHVDVSHDVIVAFSDIYIAFRVESDFVRRIELRRCRGSSITRVPGLSRAGNYGNGFRPEIKAHHAVTSVVGPVKSAIWADDKPEWIIRRFARRTSPQQG